MKKSIFSILILVAAFTTQIKPHFIQGSIYQKDGQFIVLLGDYHYGKEIQQNKDLVNQLKSYKPKETITLIENSRNKELKKTNKKYALVRQNIDPKIARTELEPKTPLVIIGDDLAKEGLSGINVDPRPITIALIEEVGLLATQSNYKPVLSKEDVINEIQENTKEIEQIGQYMQKISSPIHDLISPLITSTLALNKEACASLKKYKYSVKDIQKMDKTNMQIECAVLTSKLMLFFLNVPGALEIKTMYNIAKNKDKKIIVVCAGFAHTLEIDNLVKKLGYKLVEEAGASKTDFELDEFKGGLESIKAAQSLSDDLFRMCISFQFDRGITFEKIQKIQEEGLKKNASKSDPINIAKLFKAIEPLTS